MYLYFHLYAVFPANGLNQYFNVDNRGEGREREISLQTYNFPPAHSSHRDAYPTNVGGGIVSLPSLTEFLLYRGNSRLISPQKEARVISCPLAQLNPSRVDSYDKTRVYTVDGSNYIQVSARVPSPRSRPAPLPSRPSFLLSGLLYRTRRVSVSHRALPTPSRGPLDASTASLRSWR